MCTCWNDAGSGDCSVCGSPAPTPVLVKARSEEHKAAGAVGDAATDEFVKSLLALDGKDPAKAGSDKPVRGGAGGKAPEGDAEDPDMLRVRLLSLEAEVASRDEHVAMLQRVMAEQVAEQNATVRALWDTIGLLMVGGEAAVASMPGLALQAKQHEVVERWRTFARERKERRNAWIVAHSWSWRERAQVRVAKRMELESTRELLAEQKRSGVRLSIAEENCLRDPRLLLLKAEEDVECPICMDDCALDEVLVVECQHRVCLSCLSAYCVAEINEGRSAEMECPIAGCKHLMTYEDVEIGLRDKPAELKRFSEFLTESYLEHDPLMVRCPKPRCQTAMIRNAADAKMCVCPRESCRFTFCASCKVEWHADATCEAYQRWVKENGAADDLFEKWRAKSTKPCPKCHVPVQKNGGCVCSAVRT